MQRRVSALYDQAETATGNYNATRARSRARRTRVDSAPGDTSSAGRDPALESVTRQWFDLARAQLGPTVPAVLPADRRPNPAASRSAAPARRPAGELTASGPASDTRDRLALPAGPSATAPALPEPAAAPAAGLPSLPAGPVAVPPARELTAGPDLTASTASTSSMTSTVSTVSTVSTALVMPEPAAEPAVAPARFAPELLTSADLLTPVPAPAPWAGVAAEPAPTVAATAGTRPEAAATRPPSVARPRPEVPSSAKERLQRKMDQARGLLARQAGRGSGPATGTGAGPAGAIWYADAPSASRLTSQQLLEQWTGQPAASGPGNAPDGGRADWSGTAVSPGQPGTAATPTTGAAPDTTAPFPAVPPFPDPAAASTTAASPAWPDPATAPSPGVPVLPDPAAVLMTTAPFPTVPTYPDPPAAPTTTAPFPSVPAHPDPAAVLITTAPLPTVPTYPDPAAAPTTTAPFPTVPTYPDPPAAPTTTAPFPTVPAHPDPAAGPGPGAPVVPTTAAPLGVGDVGGTAYERKAAKALAFARAQVGKPCVWGATGPDSYDCSSLTQAAWRAAGVDLPRTAAGQAGCGTPVALAEMRAGDLILFYGDVSHVGLCTGNGLMIHAPSPGAPIREESVFFAGARAVHSAVRPA
ncbi:NlpC/P60 family protein [Streptomyces sp. NPDC046831]|uniref:C40 family peptidase n=1 Tax=Streptomyces sp. NPDC046831 TaxID=3154805 RepID=UPI0033D6B839